MWGFGEEAQFLSAMFLTRTAIYKTRRGAGLERGSRIPLVLGWNTGHVVSSTEESQIQKGVLE